MRRHTVLTVALCSAVSFLIGALVMGDGNSIPAVATVSGAPARPPAARLGATVVSVPGAVNFADVAERINASVVNIDAASRAGHETRRRNPDDAPDGPREFDLPHQGSG